MLNHKCICNQYPKFRFIKNMPVLKKRSPEIRAAFFVQSFKNDHYQLNRSGCSGLLSLLNNGKYNTERCEDAGSYYIETHCKGIRIIDSQQAACSCYEETPASCYKRKGITFNKPVFRIEPASCLAKRNICGKYPEVTHGHADGVKLCKLLQHCGCTGNKGLDQDDGA